MLIEFPKPADSIASLRTARERLAEAASLLLAGAESGARCTGPLEDAASAIRTVQGLGSLPAGARAEIETEIRELRRELARVAALVGQAASFYTGLHQALGLESGGYDSRGDAPAIAIARRVSVRG